VQGSPARPWNVKTTGTAAAVEGSQSEGKPWNKAPRKLREERRAAEADWRSWEAGRAGGGKGWENELS